ncbi:MAG: hypothetical protein PHP22_09865 [Oscillospiraceae bacterium]|nr:hypothetical protein [Oscillospiraceae bacterium]
MKTLSEMTPYGRTHTLTQRAVYRARRRRRNITLAIIIICILLLAAIVAYGIGFYQGQREGGIFLDNTVYTGLGERAVGL